VEIRVVTGQSLEDEKAIASRDESTLPSFGLAVAPVVLPVILIACATLANALKTHLPPAVVEAALLIGQKNVALFVAALVSVGVYLRQRGLKWTQTEDLVSGPLATGGVIVLITAAGGAYGGMIRFAEIGQAVQTVFAGSEINYIALAWFIAAVVRVAQGSATVAMITAVGIMASLAGEQGFGVHPLYIALAIGYGASVFSWMNDSGFWVFSRMSGLTQGETLRSWTMALTIISVAGLLQLLVLGALFPLVP
jgi:GntP family gluconate:H+ symporter